jgi:uncharacterized protein (DUF433 family)
LRSSLGITPEPWIARLTIPNYRVKEAARYAGITPQTIANWHSVSGSGFLVKREDRAALSYMQLIEIAVVASFRKAGISLKEIKNARSFLQKQISSEYPFAQYRFKTDGKALLMDYTQIDQKTGNGKLIELNKGGQLAWSAVLTRLKEFNYDRDLRFVSQWHVAGTKSVIVINPRIAFGSPAIRGTPTWTIRERWLANESIADISDEFDLQEKHVIDALEFEGVKQERRGPWVN